MREQTESRMRSVGTSSRIAFIALLAIAPAATRGTEPQDAVAIEIRKEQPSSDTCAIVRIWKEQSGKRETALWELCAHPDNAGLLVTADGKGEHREFSLNPGKEIGPIVQLTARATPFGGSWNMVVVAVASLNAERTAIEYRMIILKTDHLLPSPDGWLHTPPFTTRPADLRFDGMSISFPDGDSVVLGLHDLTRGDKNDNDRIESHFFVNHCPNVAFDTTTNHYSALTEKGETVAELKSKKSSETIEPRK